MEELIRERCAILQHVFCRSWLVRCAYQLLSHVVPSMMYEDKEVIWNKVVPLKMSTFAWRLLNQWQSQDLGSG
ncbi:hypothetical protein L195_g049240, partial [Trifolium pratense]